MSRNHNGGFIGGSDYWDIGTDAQRGRDGDTARDAAKKFNDHRHSAAIKLNPIALSDWTRESEDASVSPSSGLPGGRISQSAQPIREPGDLADHNGQLYAITSTGTKCISSGFGPYIDVSGASPTISSDFVASSYNHNLGPYNPLGIAVNSAPLTLSRAIIYPTISSHGGDTVTRTIITAGMRMDGDFPTGAYANLAPALSVAVFTRRYAYDEVSGLIGGISLPDDQPIIVTSYATEPTPGTVVQADTGYTVAEISRVLDNFTGKIEVLYVINLEGCYTVQEIETIRNATLETEAVLMDRLARDLEARLKFDILDVTTQVLCTFGG